MAHNISPEKRRRALLATELSDWPHATLAAGCRCGWRWQRPVRDLVAARSAMTLGAIAEAVRCGVPECGRPAEVVSLRMPNRDGPGERWLALRDDRGAARLEEPTYGHHERVNPFPLS